MSPSWFQPAEPVRQRFHMPGARQTAEQLRKQGEPVEQVKAFLEANSFEAELRELTGGDTATLMEMTVTETGARADFARMAQASVTLALVSWELERPPSVEAVQMLPQETVMEMYAAIPERRVTIDDYGTRANGSGPPTPAPPEAPVESKDAAALSS